MENKITQKDYYNGMIAYLNGEDTDLTVEQMIEFCEGRIELLNKKSANRKPAKDSEEKIALKNAIVDILTTDGQTVSEIISQLTDYDGLNTQKVTPILYQLIAEDKAIKISDKKKSMFAIA